LLGQKAPLNIQNDNKETPLHIACRSNNSVALKLLIESRANISIINSGF
jgi:ankyrin repeat protein